MFKADYFLISAVVNILSPYLFCTLAVITSNFGLRLQSSLIFPDNEFAFLFLSLIVGLGYFTSERRNVDFTSSFLDGKIPFFHLQAILFFFILAESVKAVDLLCLIFLLFFVNELLYEIMGRVKTMQVGVLCFLIFFFF